MGDQPLLHMQTNRAKRNPGTNASSDGIQNTNPRFKKYKMVFGAMPSVASTVVYYAEIEKFALIKL
jgi:hypothetical protein